MGEKFATPGGGITGASSVPPNNSATGGAGTARTSATFAALTTPAATTLTINTSVIVIISGHISTSAIGGIGYLGVALSGANTVAAATTSSLSIDSATVANAIQASFTIPLSSLTPGSTTFTLQYAGDGTNGCTITNANIIVIASN